MEALLEEAKIAYAKWRRERLKLNENIPEELLKLASECALHCGKIKTAKGLGLNSVKLSQAIAKYSQNSQDISLLKKKSKNNLQQESFFREVILKEKESRSYLNLDKNKEADKEIIFEIESEFGLKIKVFSNAESVHKSILSYFMQQR